MGGAFGEPVEDILSKRGAWHSCLMKWGACLRTFWPSPKFLNFKAFEDVFSERDIPFCFGAFFTMFGQLVLLRRCYSARVIIWRSDQVSRPMWTSSARTIVVNAFKR